MEKDSVGVESRSDVGVVQEEGSFGQCGVLEEEECRELEQVEVEETVIYEKEERRRMYGGGSMYDNVKRRRVEQKRKVCISL